MSVLGRGSQCLSSTVVSPLILWVRRDRSLTGFVDFFLSCSLIVFIKTLTFVTVDMLCLKFHKNDLVHVHPSLFFSSVIPV